MVNSAFAPADAPFVRNIVSSGVSYPSLLSRKEEIVFIK